MHLIKSNFVFNNLYKKISYAIDNFYYEIQNIIDMIDIDNNLYYFIHNNSINYRKKAIFFYIIFNIEIISILIINYIQSFNINKSNIYDFIKLMYTKKNWIKLIIITAIPLNNFIEESIIYYIQNINKKRRFFLEKKVNKNIIGGLILRLDDKEWDNSLENCIQKLKIYLKHHINASY